MIIKISYFQKLFRHQNICLCHPRAGGDPVQILDSRLRGNDN